MSGSENRQRNMGFNVLISILGALSLLVMVNHLGARHYMRWDTTSSGLYTLSQKTQAVTRGLKTDVQLYVLWSNSDPLFSQIDEILAGYKALSSRLHVTVHDPDEDPEQFAMLLEKYGKVTVNEMGQAAFEAGIIVECGDNVRFLPADRFQEMDMDEVIDGSTPDVHFNAEGQLTGALMGVTRARKQMICFTAGHGEWQYEGNSRESLRHLKRELKIDGFETRPLAITEEGGVPGGCDAVVVAGPKNAFRKSEANLLETYFNKGGRVLLLLDPVTEKEAFVPTGLETFTARNGIEIRSDVVLETDPRRLVSETPFTFLVDRFYNHSAVKPLVGGGAGPKPVVFSIARSLRQVDTGEAISDILAGTSAVSWGEVTLSSLQDGGVPNQDELDAEGPMAIAMSSLRGTTDGKGAGRLVVVGDSDFLSEELFVNASLYNRDFWSSLTGWLTERKDMVSIAPKNPRQVQLVMSDNDFSNLLITLLMELFLIVIIGVMVIYRRRK